MDFEALIDTINMALEAADWQTVLTLAPSLQQAAHEVGETELVELIADLRWIARDALLHPLEMARVLAL